MSRLAGAVLACMLAPLAVLGPASCSKGSSTTQARGPFLSIMTCDGAIGPAGPFGALPPGSVALALGGLPPGELARVRQHLAESTDTTLRRAAPEVFELEDRTSDDAGADPLRQALPDLPALTAAANLLGSPWDGPGVAAQLGPACAAGAERCVPLFATPAEPGDSLVRRGRALAWALGNAALVRAKAGSREPLLRALREAQLRPSSTLAVVFGAPRGRLEAAELEPLRREALRALGDLAHDSPRRPWLEALAAARADWELPIALDDDQVLVIPRLSALARLQDFTSEVERAGPFDWVARPGAAAGVRTP
jgi:hypothetical protein